jgi:hypothetical protein
MRQTMWGALAAGAMLAGGSAAWANDTVRLGGPSAAESMQGETDTELAHWRGGRGYGGYGRGYGGYGRGFSVNFYGGRGYYGGGGWGHRGYGGYGLGYYGGHYGRSFYRPYYASYYYPSYNYYQPYYYSSYSYYPCAGDTVIAPTYAVQQNYQYSAPQSQLLPAPQQQQQQQQYVPPMPPASNPGQYQYDGGPNAPVPMPAQDVNPTRRPGGIIPLDGRLVSMPSAISGGTSQVGIPQRSTTKAVPRVNYPAYGE